MSESNILPVAATTLATLMITLGCLGFLALLRLLLQGGGKPGRTGDSE